MKSARQALLLLLPLLVTGCNSESQKSPALLSNSTTNQLTNFQPASEQEATQLVSQIEAAVAHGNTGEFNGLIDENQVYDRILAGIEISAAERDGLISGMRQGGGISSLCNEIMAAVQNGGSYQYVRMVHRDSEYRPLFRLTLPNSGGINYHELIVAKSPSGVPRIADIHVFLTGETISQTVRRVLIPAFASQNRGIVAKLTGAEAEMIQSAETVQKMNEQIKLGQGKEALALFATLPEALRKDKSILMMKLMAAQSASDEEYTAVIQELELLYPEDSSRDFRAIDLYAMQQKHDELIASVDRLRKNIDDPYLSMLKVDALLALDRIEDARAAVSEAKSAPGAGIDVYWMEVGLTLKTREFTETAKLLDEIEQKFQMAFNDLSTIPEYAEFAASEPGQEWISRHPPTPAEPNP